MIPLEKIRALPQTYRMTIPLDYLDEMGHMNVRWYMAMYDRAAWASFALFGETLDLMQTQHAGVFALQQFINYFAEVRVGETVTIHSRFLARSDKRLHKIHFMINEDKGALASTMEALAIQIDMTTRRSSLWLPDVGHMMDKLIAQHQALDWDAPLCGAMKI